MKLGIVGVGRVILGLDLTMVARHLVDDLVLVGRRRDAARVPLAPRVHSKLQVPFFFWR